MLPLLLALTGCAMLIRPVTSGFTSNLASAILDQDDPEIVRDGAPAYLMAIDGMIAGNPDDTELLLLGAQLYGAYNSAFVADEARRLRLSDRAFGYAQRALCEQRASVCEAADRPYEEFIASLGETGAGDVPSLYGFGAAWASWVQARAGDWGAVAQIPKIEALMQRVVELDEPYEDGAAHLYLGVLLTQRPASLGGKPEQAREHFERTIELSEGRDLMAKVLYAQQYARLVFDRPLHDRLLGEVVAADPAAPGRTLANTLAQQQARVLLADADEYF